MSITKTTTSLNTLKINYLTQEMYDDALENNEINENELYCTPETDFTLEDVGIHISTTAPTSSDGEDGEMWVVYTA